jgi:hypothetical protein
MLRAIPSGDLRLGSALGTNTVCTNSSTCSSAIAAPIPQTESWNYSLGHWVEDDPVVGDHAFSSAGVLGFYPWIDSNKRFYGILARRAADGAGGTPCYDSAVCERLVRRAWMTGNQVTG